jgi:hypothetical protein
VGSVEDAASVTEGLASTAGRQLVGPIPGMDVLEHKDVSLVGARRARRRRGLGPELIGHGLPETYALPWDEEAFNQSVLADPTSQWRQRPLVTVPGLPNSPIGSRRFPDRSSSWVVQEEIRGYRTEGRPCLVRTFALVASLEPLVVYVLAGDLHLIEPDDGESALYCVAPIPGAEGVDRTWCLPVEPDRFIGQLAELVSDVIIGSREVVLRHQLEEAASVGGRAQLVGFTVQLDEHMAPWLLEVDTAPLDGALPEGISANIVAEMLAALEEVDGVRLRAPNRVGSFVRAVPSNPPSASLAALAVPRPSDLAIAAVELPAEPGLTFDRAPGLRWWILGDQVAFFEPSRGNLSIANATGSFVWIAYTDGLGPDQIAAELARAFSIAEDRTLAQVHNVFGDWVDAGILSRAGTVADAPDPQTARSERLRVRHHPWNIERVYRCLGSSISVRFPRHDHADWVDRALNGLIDPSPREIVAFSEVVDQRGHWVVTGTHHAPWAAPTDHQLPAVVRHAVLMSAARSSSWPAFEATGLIADGSLVVVVGPQSHRAQLAVRWVAAGGCILADNLVALDDDLLVQPARTGFALNPDYQWIDGALQPMGHPPAPMIDLEGREVRYWFAAPTTMSADPCAATALVVMMPEGEEALVELAQGEALRQLLFYPPVGRLAMEESEAMPTVEWLSGLQCFASVAGDPRRLTSDLRRLCGAYRPEA